MLGIRCRFAEVAVGDTPLKERFIRTPWNHAQWVRGLRDAPDGIGVCNGIYNATRPITPTQKPHPSLHNHQNPSKPHVQDTRRLPL